MLNAIAKHVPWLIGGSADLAPSTMTLLTFPEAGGDFDAAHYGGRNLHFGIREHGMAAACNGMALSHLRPYGATFFVFTDYCSRACGSRRSCGSTRSTCSRTTRSAWAKTARRISRSSTWPRRAVPSLIMLRPGDANEVAEAWRAIMPIKDRPVALVLTRQNLPTLDRTKYAPAAGVAKGGYVLADAAGGKPEVILMATGSELSLAVEAYEKLKAEGVKARVVSMPSWELFESRTTAYRDSVLPPDVTARVAVEAAAKFGWERYLGLQRPLRRHDRLRRQRPCRRAVQALRHHRRRRRRGGEGSDCGQVGVTRTVRT